MCKANPELGHSAWVTSIVSDKQKKPKEHWLFRSLLYKENHALDAWFDEAYGDEQKTLLQ